MTSATLNGKPPAINLQPLPVAVAYLKRFPTNLHLSSSTVADALDRTTARDENISKLLLKSPPL